MKRNLLVLLCTLGFLSQKAQNTEFCGTNQHLNRLLENDPGLKATFLKHNQEAKTRDSLSALHGQANKISSITSFTIPVVFHVLHQGGPENISDAQIIDQIAILNRDFRKKNADTTLIIPQFKNLAADCNIEFRLATKDEAGNCTTGITRHYDADTYWNQLPSEYKYTWNSTKYLNIYVVKSFPDNSGLAAYSSFPGTNTNAMDVIVSLSSYVGSIGTGSDYSSRVMTHEVGHFFDLHHVWGDNAIGTTCGDDGVSDTPVTKGWNSCPALPAAVCNTTITENYQNYMEYSYCYYMFSAGQAARMATALNSPVSGRNNLSSNANLIATGIINPGTNCSLVPSFYTQQQSYVVCAGQSINFKDDSYNGTVASRLWSATGSATASAPTASSTNILFPTAGTQTVTLQVSNSTSTVSTTKTVTVLSNVANINYNYPESFEASGLPANFSVINPNNDVTWEQNSIVAASGVSCYYLAGGGNSPGRVDILETASYDFASDPDATFTFKYAYARNTSTHADLFKVQASGNCGGTWVDIYQPSVASMAQNSGGITSSPYFPSQSEFKTYTLTDHPTFASFKPMSNVRIRFYFQEDATVGFGNNFFLDDINFNSVNVGLNELGRSLSFTLFPNPSRSGAELQFTLSESANINLKVTDVTGRLVETERFATLSPGTHVFKVNENQKLNAGIYLVNFTFNGQQISRKLIIE
jgi:hypothetical protein